METQFRLVKLIDIYQDFMMICNYYGSAPPYQTTYALSLKHQPKRYYYYR
jgi:hypothetical protein